MSYGSTRSTSYTYSRSFEFCICGREFTTRGINAHIKANHPELFRNVEEARTMAIEENNHRDIAQAFPELVTKAAETNPEYAPAAYLPATEEATTEPRPIVRTAVYTKPRTVRTVTLEALPAGKWTPFLVRAQKGTGRVIYAASALTIEEAHAEFAKACEWVESLGLTLDSETGAPVEEPLKAAEARWDANATERATNADTTDAYLAGLEADARVTDVAEAQELAVQEERIRLSRWNAELGWNLRNPEMTVQEAGAATRAKFPHYRPTVTVVGPQAICREHGVYTLYGEGQHRPCPQCSEPVTAFELGEYVALFESIPLAEGHSPEESFATRYRIVQNVEPAWHDMRTAEELEASKPQPVTYEPCGCLTNSAGAHRGGCSGDNTERAQARRLAESQGWKVTEEGLKDFGDAWERGGRTLVAIYEIDRGDKRPYGSLVRGCVGTWTKPTERTADAIRDAWADDTIRFTTFQEFAEHVTGRTVSEAADALLDDRETGEIPEWGTHPEHAVAAVWSQRNTYGGHVTRFVLTQRSRELITEGALDLAVALGWLTETSDGRTTKPEYRRYQVADRVRNLAMLRVAERNRYYSVAVLDSRVLAAEDGGVTRLTIGTKRVDHRARWCLVRERVNPATLELTVQGEYLRWDKAEAQAELSRRVSSLIGWGWSQAYRLTGDGVTLVR